MIRRTFLPGLLSLGLLSAAMAGGKMRVTADGVNVRCGPGTRFEIVCQADKGDLVTVRRTTEEWAEVAPPADARLWVYAELIEDAAVIASRVQIRSGPGISYRPAGKLDQGYKVSVEETVGDWVRIAPPPEASVWISNEFLESPDAPAKKPDPAPAKPAPAKPAAPAPAPKPAVKPQPQDKPAVSAPSQPKPAPVASRPSPPKPRPDDHVDDPADEASASPLPVALQGRRLAEDRRQGEFVKLEGEIRTARSAWGKLSSYRLVGHDAEGRIITRCYLLGNRKQLESILGRRASIDGRQYWVHRVRYPGVRPDRIRLYPERP
ncbi:MAG: SH3 domain-containing protein [Kiritimatiellae bacterium]|nr:SH3 domain-containing protein [Kiritimatiellia bacterium]